MTVRSVFLVACATLGSMGCSPKPAATTVTPSGPAAVVDPGPLSCPDSTDIYTIPNTISTRFKLFQRDANHGVPACYVEAVARHEREYSDSTIVATLAMSDAVLARAPGDLANLSARPTLLYRMARYSEVPAAFDAMLRADTSRATLANYRVALAATVRSGDAATRLRLLTAAARRFPTTESITADYNIQRQLPRLRALIDSSHQVLRLDPRRVERYATLASVYGNLDVGDSALHYTRRALQAGVPRNEVAPSLQSWIGVVMRKAQLLDAPDIWNTTLAQARRIDQTLPTDASKHLLGLSILNVAASYARRAGALPPPGAQEDPTRAVAQQEERAQICRDLAKVPGMLEETRQAMNQGGSRFSTASVPAIQNGAAAVARQYAELAPRCPR